MKNKMLHLFLSALLFFSCMPSKSISFFGYFKARRDYSREGEIAQFDRMLNQKASRIYWKDSILYKTTFKKNVFKNSPEGIKKYGRPYSPKFLPSPSWTLPVETYKLNNLFKFAMSKVPHYSNKIAHCSYGSERFPHEITNVPVIENRECSIEEIENAWPYLQPIKIYLKNGYQLKGIQHAKPTIVSVQREKGPLFEDQTLYQLNEVKEENWIKDFPVDPEEWKPKL